MQTLEQDIVGHLKQIGIECRDKITPIIDAKVHRVFTIEDKETSNINEDATGYYICFDNGTGEKGERLVGGCVGSVRHDRQENFSNYDYEKLTPEQKIIVENNYKKRDEFLAKERKEAKDLAAHMWKNSKQDFSHPYLEHKRIKNTVAIRLYKDEILIIPAFDKSNNLSTLQLISYDDDRKEFKKRFLKCGIKKGCFCDIGKELESEKIYIAEGYATASTIFEATKCHTIIAFDSGNLLSVGKTIREKYPAKQIIFAADNDQWGADKTKNTGIDAANAAAKIIPNSKVAVPQFDVEKFKDAEKKPTDFNDLFLIEKDLGEVKRQLESAKEIPISKDKADINLTEETKKTKNKTATTLLIEITNKMELFHDDKKQAYAIIEQNKIRKIFAVNSDAFEDLLSYRYYKLKGEGCNKTSIQNALCTIKAKALHDNKQRSVFTRIARIDNKIYIDLCDDNRRVVEITKDGWKVLNKSPVMFRRKKHMKALPEPLRGGKLDHLWEFISVKRAEDKHVVRGWLLCALRGIPPFFVLNILGGQGGGKTFVTSVLRDLIDPSIGKTRGLPRDSREMLAAVANNYVMAIDNVSRIIDDTSDDLCRVAHGSAISERELYTNDEEVLHKVGNPIILNSIGNAVTRPDLQDRCISIGLKTLKPSERIAEKKLLLIYANKKPYISGALYDLVSLALRHENDITLKDSPRMIDCTEWITAAERGSETLKEGTFLEIYKKNARDSVDDVIESSPIANAILSFMENRLNWEGTAAELSNELDQFAGDKKQKQRGWTHNPSTLRNIINRYLSQFEELRITFEDIHRKKNRRAMKITNLNNLSDLGKE
jgi:phage/plasmid primase-like uncharacterized protein